MPRVSFEFLQIASLSRRRHGFDSRTGRQSYQSFRKSPIFAEGPLSFWLLLVFLASDVSVQVYLNIVAGGEKSWREFHQSWRELFFKIIEDSLPPTVVEPGGEHW